VSQDEHAQGQGALKPAPHIEIDVLESNERPLCRSCVDWSERKHHLGGAVGAAVLSHALVKSWAVRGPHSCAVTFSVLGEKKFAEKLASACPSLASSVIATTTPSFSDFSASGEMRLVSISRASGE
jgi:hypothetical protein